MKKLMCLITALTLAMSVPIVTNAQTVYISQGSSYAYTMFGASWNVINGSGAISFGKEVSVSAPLSGYARIRAQVNVLSWMTDEQKLLLKNAESVVMTFAFHDDYYLDPSNLADKLSWITMFYCGDYDWSGDVSLNLGSVDPALSKKSGTVDLGSALSGMDLSKLGVYITHQFSASEANYSIGYILHWLQIKIDVVGVDGSSTQMVIQMQGLQDSIDQGFDNMGDKLDGVQDSIDQGFNGVLTPDSGDQQISDQFGSDVSDKKDESDKLRDEMEKLDKPVFEVDDINPMDKVDENDVQFVGDTFNTIFQSNTLLTFATMALVFVLLGYILYGKRG